LLFLNDIQFTIFDLFLGYFNCLLSICGNIAFTIALQSGKGGPIQAIDSMKTLVTLGVNMLLTGLIPTWLQWSGVGLGITGAAIVGLFK
jgi:drug/metabolite transporter (DMT)-like permease